LICLVTPRCRKMARLISEEQEKPLSRITRLRMRWHYGICVWCKRYHDQIGLLGKLSRMFAEESCKQGENQFNEDAKERIKEALRHKGND
jgi:hypothetical protein